MYLFILYIYIYLFFCCLIRSCKTDSSKAVSSDLPSIYYKQQKIHARDNKVNILFDVALTSAKVKLTIMTTV